MERAAHGEQYRKGLLAEAVNEILEGNLSAGKAMLRDFSNATITFPALAQKLNKSSKSIHRMLGPSGNPRMDSVMGILKVLQDQEQIRLHTRY
jgi:DNA-binding phage protein